MRNRFGRISLFVTMFLVLFSLSFPTLAQDDLTEKFSFDSGATFSYPKAWKLDKKSDPLKLVSDQTQLLVVDYAGLTAAGLYQLNVTVPELPDGDHVVTADVAGMRTPAISKIRIRHGIE